MTYSRGGCLIWSRWGCLTWSSSAHACIRCAIDMQGGWSGSPQPAVGGGRCGNRSRYSSEIWYGEWTDWIAKYQNCGRAGCLAAASISCTDFSVYMYEEYRQTFEVVLPSAQVHTPCKPQPVNRNQPQPLSQKCPEESSLWWRLLCACSYFRRACAVVARISRGAVALVEVCDVRVRVPAVRGSGSLSGVVHAAVPEHVCVVPKGNTESSVSSENHHCTI